jgi:Lrp/AsnC family leucine-responsive transcriptional regulator
MINDTGGVGVKTLSKKKPYAIDEIGWLILEELQNNARISFKELSQKVNLSVTAVIERVRCMEDEGIITGYKAMIDTRKAGFSLTTLINMSTSYGNPDKIVGDVISGIPEVVSCWSVTGANDYVIEAHVPTLEFMEELLTELSRYGKLTTSIVLPSTLKKRFIKKPRTNMKSHQ